MSWIVDAPFTYFQKFCVNIVKCGPIPKHVAFIMDGNRRYATKANVEKFEGHSRGFEKLAETLQWCLELGITEVTVYAFSIENFKRSQEEVDALMKLAREKFQKLFEEKERLMEDGVCIRIIGKLSMLPADLRKMMAETVLMTKDNNKAFLNVAFAYTSRDEIATTLDSIVEGVRNNEITVDDIDESLIDSCLFTNLSPKPDIIVRTSGEVRFSDYLLWQVSSHSLVYFNKVLWPEFSIWHLLACVFKYQRSYKTLKKYENSYNVNSCPNSNVECFLKKFQERRFAMLEGYVNS